MDIYGFAEGNLDCLLLVDGDYVVNGDYMLVHVGKEVFIPVTYIKVVYLGEAPKVYRFASGWIDYNRTLEVARKNWTFTKRLRPTKIPRLHQPHKRRHD